MVQKTTKFFNLVLLILLFGCDNRVAKEKQEASKNTATSVQKANDLITIGAFDQAVSLLDKEIQNNPRNKDAHLAMANCLASKYCRMVVTDKDKPDGLINGEVSKIQRSQVKRQAIEFYENALKVDPANLAALYNLARFLRNEDELQQFKEVYKRLRTVTGNTIDTQLLGFGTGESTLNWSIYMPVLVKEPIFELRPETNRGTIIVSKENANALLNTDGVESTITLKRYTVFDKAKKLNGIITFYFDTFDITDKEEELYRVVIYLNTLWTDGQRYSPIYKNYYQGLLFNRILNAKEANVLASTPWLNGEGPGVINVTLEKLFSGVYSDFGSWSVMREHPEYVIDTSLVSAREKDYRNITEVNEPPTIFKTAGGKDGKIVFNKVKSRKYIRSTERYAKINAESVIYGCGDARYDDMLVRVLTVENAFPDEFIRKCMAGKCYKGTPDTIVAALCIGGVVGEEKTYVGGKYVEVVKERMTGKVITFENGVLATIK